MRRSLSRLADDILSEQGVDIKDAARQPFSFLTQGSTDFVRRPGTSNSEAGQQPVYAHTLPNFRRSRIYSEATPRSLRPESSRVRAT